MPAEDSLELKMRQFFCLIFNRDKLNIADGTSIETRKKSQTNHVQNFQPITDTLVVLVNTCFYLPSGSQVFALSHSVDLAVGFVRVQSDF